MYIKIIYMKYIYRQPIRVDSKSNSNRLHTVNTKKKLSRPFSNCGRGMILFFEKVSPSSLDGIPLGDLYHGALSKEPGQPGAGPTFKL